MLKINKVSVSLKLGFQWKLISFFLILCTVLIYYITDAWIIHLTKIDWLYLVKRSLLFRQAWHAPVFSWGLLAFIWHFHKEISILRIGLILTTSILLWIFFGLEIRIQGPRNSFKTFLGWWAMLVVGWWVDQI